MVGGDVGFWAERGDCPGPNCASEAISGTSIPVPERLETSDFARECLDDFVLAREGIGLRSALADAADLPLTDLTAGTDGRSLSCQEKRPNPLCPKVAWPGGRTSPYEVSEESMEIR